MPMYATSVSFRPMPIKHFVQLVRARARYHFDSDIYESASEELYESLTLEDFKRRYGTVHLNLQKV